MTTNRRQMTIQLYPERHPHLYEKYFDENGQRRNELKPSQEIPLLAEKQLSGESDSALMESLDRIEKAIKALKLAGVVDDKQEQHLKQRANALKGKIPVLR